MKTLKTAVAGLALLALPGAGHALPLIDFEIGAAAWSMNPSGWVQGDGDRQDVEDDLGFSSKTSGFAWASLEHAVPLIPNVRLAHTPVSLSGSGSSAFVIGGETFAQDYDTDLTLNQTDVTLYWSPLNNVVSVDFGLNVKFIDGELEVRSSDPNQEPFKEPFSAPLPTLYLSGGVKLPFTGLSAKAEVSYLSISGNRVVDGSARLAYKALPTLSIVAGYRIQQMKIDDIADDFGADIELSGPFLGMTFSF